MRKEKIVLALALLLLVSLPMVASAASLCDVQGCNITEEHTHNGRQYAGHSADDGHGYHQVCSVKNCTQTGSHEHNGVTHLPHSNEDGHNYHSSTEHNGNGNSGHNSGGHNRSGGHH